MTKKILIADDSAMNRALLSDMLGSEYDITETENGADAVEILREHVTEYSMLLLDIQMPVMDGFEVLAYMNKYHWIETVPVIMISSETSPAQIARAYDLGATDFIPRPFDESVVQQRINNAILLAAKTRRLTDIVVEQVHERQKSDRLMISILAHIVEFRNGESGLHVLHINIITELLLRQLMLRSNRYGLTAEDVSLITTASSLHDIGKLTIPEEILNKPGRFTPEEFAVMQNHAAAGAEMLNDLPFNKTEPLLRVSSEICRWHHERYDGAGYPDGISRDAIPISAQVVSLADVYDALTSDRCYKKAYSHEEAIRMILNGECGNFNPELLEVLQDLSNDLQKELAIKSVPPQDFDDSEIRRITDRIHNYTPPTAEHVLNLLEYERKRFNATADLSAEIFFSYNFQSQTLTLNEYAANKLRLPSVIAKPQQTPALLEHIDARAQDSLLQFLENANTDTLQTEITVQYKGKATRRKLICKLFRLFETDEKPFSVTGKIIP